MAETENETLNVVKVEEPKFYVHELRQHSQELFGVKPEVFDGAVFGVKDNQITKSEVRKRIEEFLKKEVKA